MPKYTIDELEISSDEENYIEKLRLSERKVLRKSFGENYF